MDKIKVVWLCHFSNPEIQSLLPLWRKPQPEFAFWISNMLRGFEHQPNIEIHIISPHNYLKSSANFKLRNIHYHFIPSGIPVIHLQWPLFFKFDIYTNYFFYRRKIKKAIHNINPDLIDLIGAENSYYSSPILDLKKDYPILVTIQGFISQLKAEKSKFHTEFKKRAATEEKILQSFKYYAGEQDSSTYISGFNPLHVFFRLYFPVNEKLSLSATDNGKNYDCIYFGNLSKIKGADDFIKVISEIKLKRSGVKACVIGSGDISALKTLANNLNCIDNIEFIGYLQTQKELFEYVKSSRVFLVPPYFERLSSTIREAMFLKVPIVAYSTGGIPYINEFDENIYLVKTGDYQEMARKTILLLENDLDRNNLAEKAFQYAKREFSLNVNADRLIDAYQTILNDIKNK